MRPILRATFGVVLEPATPCRAADDTAAAVVRSYRLGMAIDVEQSASHGSTTWYSTESMEVNGLHPLCWVNGAMTAPNPRLHPDSALLALTEHALQSSSWRFEDFVGVENLLIGRYAHAIGASGLLQYRRLLIVEQANATLDVIAVRPLEVAWVLAHRALLAQDPFALGAYPLRQPYWDLYERFKSAPWADDLAWHAAMLRRPTDECYSDCILRAGIIEGPMQYWIRFPRGKAIAAALAAGITAAQQAADLACFGGVAAANSEEPDGSGAGVEARAARLFVQGRIQMLKRDDFRTVHLSASARGRRN